MKTSTKRKLNRKKNFKRKSQKKNLLDLPYEIMEKIVNRIGFKAKLRVRATCRILRDTHDACAAHNLKVALNLGAKNARAAKKLSALNTVLELATKAYSQNGYYNACSQLTNILYKPKPGHHIRVPYFSRVRSLLLRFYTHIHSDMCGNDPNQSISNKCYVLTILGLLNGFKSSTRFITFVSPNHVKISYEMIGNWIIVLWSSTSVLTLMNEDKFYFLAIVADLLYNDQNNGYFRALWDTGDKVFSYGRRSQASKRKKMVTTIFEINLNGNEEVLTALKEPITDLPGIILKNCTIFIDIACRDTSHWGCKDSHRINIQ